MHIHKQTVLRAVWRCLGSVLIKRNSSVIRRLRSLPPAQEMHEAECAAAREAHEREMQRVKRFNQEIWPKVHVARIAQVSGCGEQCDVTRSRERADSTFHSVVLGTGADGLQNVAPSRCSEQCPVSITPPPPNPAG